MIALALLLQAAAPTQGCADLGKTDPARAVQLASGWHAQGGGALARQCAAIVAVYEPAGRIPTGDFGDETPSSAELARREKWAREA